MTTVRLDDPGGQDFIPGAVAQVRLSRDLRMVVIRETPGGNAYDMLVRFFSCRVYIDLNYHDTLRYE
jgi:hypothetical protein